MKKNTTTKSQLHPRNKHKEQYNFDRLIAASPSLSSFVSLNKYGNQSVDFFNPKAVKALNKAILKLHYSINYWEIPEDYLCPPIPGRVDYIHYLADLLSAEKEIPTGNKIRCLDIGTGANCIYPILGNAEYQWSFLGTDTDDKALKAAKKTVLNNEQLKQSVQLSKQPNKQLFFKGILTKTDRFDATLCNPPFHSSADEAQNASNRKNTNLKKQTVKNAALNFGGKNNELWYEGGEYTFVRKMIFESQEFSNNCLWFTTLVSKKENLRHFYKALEEVKAVEVKTIEMKQGQKVSRILCWTFLPTEKQKIWKELRWS